MIKINEHLYIGQGYGHLNTVFVRAPDGLVLVDVTAYNPTVNGFREIHPEEIRHIGYLGIGSWTSRDMSFPHRYVPVKAIVYTHSDIYAERFSQVLTEALADSPDLQVYAWTVDPARDPMTIVGPAVYQRAVKSGETRSGPESTGQERSSGGDDIQRNKSFDRDTAKKEWPINVMREKITDVNIAGLEIQFVQIPGPGNQLGVWIKPLNAFICGQIFHSAYPSLYAMRGTEPRDPLVWIESLDWIRQLRPEILIPSHAEPIQGRDEIVKTVTNFRDSIQFAHDQTLRYVNRQYHPVEIGQMLKLPPHLKDEPYLDEKYCVLQWAVRAVFNKYMGWFSGDIEELTGYPPSEEAARLVRLGGGVEDVVEKAQVALSQRDYQWALELATSVLHVDKKNQPAAGIRRQALKDLADLHPSEFARNYYLASASEEYVKWPSPRNFALYLPIEQLLRFMSTWIDPGLCKTTNLRLVLRFSDLRRTFKLHLRNSIIELTELGHAFVGFSSLQKTTSVAETRLACEIAVPSFLWRAILGQLEPHARLLGNEEVKVKGDVNCIQQLFSCLELMAPDYDFEF